MVNFGKTLEEQFALLEARSKAEAEGLSHDDLLGKLKDINENSIDALSPKAIEVRAAELFKTIEKARLRFLESGDKEKHLKPLSNLLRRHALLIELSKTSNSNAISKDWKRQAEQEQEEKRQELAQRRARDQPASQYNQNSYGKHNALSASRGASRGGGAGSRGKAMVSQANAPNPSTVNNSNPIRSRTRARDAAVGVVKGIDSTAFNINAEYNEYLDGPGPSNRNGTCSGCDRTMSMDKLVRKEDVGFICQSCENDQHDLTIGDRTREVAEYGRKRKQQVPTHNKPQQVHADKFFSNGASDFNTLLVQQPRFKETNQLHQNSSDRLGTREHTGTRGYTSLAPFLGTVNGGTGVLQDQQQQQQRPQPQQAAGRQRFPASQTNYRTSQRRSTRQTSLDRIIKVDTHGTDANPINLLDDDDDDDVDSDEGASDMERALRAASIADRSTKQRVTRLASGVINPSTVMRLQGLRCLMPPEGGAGAVEFTAADLARLAPDEFLNDTAIDYYLRYVRMKLENERPEDAARCYFFNSFFYKKLSEKGNGGGGGMNAAAAASYTKVEKWTRSVDIFAKDYIFVPIHDHLHWSLMIICHPGAEVPKQTRKRPGSAGGSGTSTGGGGTKKRSVGSDVVVGLDRDKTGDEDEDENPTIIAHRREAVLKNQKGDTAAGEEDEIEIQDKEEEKKPKEAVQDPRVAPHPEPFFLHLDSLGGGHSSEIITKTLKSYLKCEWEARIADPKGVEGSVPKKWAQEQAEKKTWKKKKPAAAAADAADATDDAGPSSNVPVIPKRLFSGMEKIKMSIPKQDNHCDCGLFVCVFVEFFTAALPKALNISALNALKKNYNKDGIDLWEGSMRNGSSTGEEEPAWYPGFLTKHWFKHENASNLRWELLRMVLVNMAIAAGVMDDTGSNYTVDQLKKSISGVQAQALMDEIESAGRYQVDNGYIRPDIWRHQGIESKIKRAETRKRQEEERKGKELAMKMQKEEEERRVSNTRYSRGRDCVIENSSDEEEKEKKITKAVEKKKKESGFSNFLFGPQEPEPSSQGPVWKDPHRPEMSLQNNGPDEDFGIDLGEDESDSGGGGGGIDCGGERIGGAAAVDGDEKKEVEEDENEDEIIDIESQENNRLPNTENTPFTEMGRLYSCGNEGNDSEAARAAVAAAAATAPSPEAPMNGVEYAEESSGDGKGYHDAVEFIDEDTRPKEGADSLLDPLFTAGLFDEGDGKHGGASVRQQQNNTVRRLPLNLRRSSKGKQDAKKVLEAVTKNAEALIDSNELPPDLEKATRCILSREQKDNTVASAKLVLEYTILPPFEVQLIGHDAFFKITNWYLLWGKDLSKTCEHVLPNGLKKASVKSAANIRLLQNQELERGGNDGTGAASLQTTEELPDHEHGTGAAHLLEEETSPLKFTAKYRRSQGPRTFGGHGGAAINKHTHFDDHGNAIGEDEDLESDDEDEQPPAKKKPPRNLSATTANKRRKNNNSDTAAAANTVTANGRNPPAMYVGEFEFPSQEEHEGHHQQKSNKPKKKQQRITPANGNGNRVGSYGAGKSPPVSSRQQNQGNKLQKGPRTQGGRKMADMTEKLQRNLRNAGGNNLNAGQNNQRRVRGGGGGGQMKAAATVDLTEEPASPIL